jgi:hypothetical protein
MVAFDVADDRLNSGSPFHLAAYRSGDASYLARDPDLELVGMVVAAIALVDVDTGDLDAGELLGVGDDGPKRMAVEGIAVQRLGVQGELTALGFGDGRRDRDLAPKLVG